MKKIVGIIAAVAMAASVFAVDFTAGFQLKADLFNYDGASKTIGALKLWPENTKDDKPFIFSVNGDRAGGTLKFYDAGIFNDDAGNQEKLVLNNGKTGADEKTKALDGTPMMANYWNIWFKPLDMLKIELGAQDIKLNCETVTYWKGKIFGTSDWGYKAAVEVDALQIAVALLPSKGNFWMGKADGFDAVIGETAVYAQYGADFGTIKFLFDAKAAGGKNFKNIFVGAGYSNKFGDISMFADVGFNKVDTINGLAVDADAKYSKDAFGAEAYIQWSAGNLETIKKETMGLMFIAKASYALDAGTVYAKARIDNLFAEKMPIEFIAVGFDGNMGALSYEIEADIKTQVVAGESKASFSMPSWFRIAF